MSIKYKFTCPHCAAALEVIIPKETAKHYDTVRAICSQCNGHVDVVNHYKVASKIEEEAAKHENVIGADDVANLIIDVETCKSVDEFLQKIN